MKHFTLKRLTLCVMALLAMGAVNAATETYDFESFANTLSDANEHYPSYDGTRIFNVQNTSWIDIQKMSMDDYDLNGRFAAEVRAANGFNFRKAGSSWNGLNSGYNAVRYFSILNLKAGDKVTVTYNQGNLYCYKRDGSADAGLDDGVAVASEITYTIISDGRFDMKTGESKVNIQKVAIEPAAESIAIGVKNENYDFESIASGTAFATTGAANTTIKLGVNDNDFNGRFSLGTDSRNIAFKGAGYGLQLIYQNRGLFINDLKVGEQVKVDYITEGSQAFKFVNGGNVGEEATATVKSGSWYTVETDGQLQMINTTNGGSDKTNIKSVVIKTIDNTITATTLVSTKALDFTGTDVNAYIATGTNETSVVMEQKYKIPANTPVYITATSGGYYTIPLLEGDADDVSENKLMAGANAKIASDATYTYYVYGVKSGVAGFYKVSTSGITVPTGKAYLRIDTPTTARDFLDFTFGEQTTTAINAIEQQRTDGVFYNMAGQRIQNPTRGLYIVNGKKVIIK